MQAHISAACAGLGTDNLIKVECNDVGQMLPNALEQALVLVREQGKVGPSKHDYCMY